MKQFAFGAGSCLKGRVLRHPYMRSVVAVTLLLTFAYYAFAQSIKPTAKPAPAASPAPEVKPNALSGTAAGAARVDDNYRDYKFRVHYGKSIVAGFAGYAEIGNAQKKTAGSGRPLPGQVPVTVPGSLVGSSGSVTLNCSPSRANGADPVGRKSLPDDAWTINLACPIPYDEVTLQQGATHDQDFASWLSDVHSGRGRDFSVEVTHGAGMEAYNLKGCTVANARTSRALDLGASFTNIATLELHCAGVER